MGKRILILFLVAFLSACGSGGDSSTNGSSSSASALAGAAHYQGLRSQAALSAQSTGDFLYYLLFLPDYFVINNLDAEDPRITVTDSRTADRLGHVIVRFDNFVGEDNLTYNGEIDYEIKADNESRLLVTSHINSLRVSSNSYKVLVHNSYDELTYPDLESIAIDYTLNGTFTEDWGLNGSLVLNYESIAFDDHQNGKTALLENVVKRIGTDNNGNVGVNQVSGKLYVSGQGYVSIALNSNGYYTLTGADQSAITYRPVPHPQKLSVLTSWGTEADIIYSTVTSETVSNNPPQVNNLSLIPQEVYESTGINLDYSSIYDDEGDSFTSEIRWYSDGVLIEGESDFYLYSDNVKKGQEITASIVVTSRGETTVHSTSVTVSNHSPELGYVSIYPYEPTVNDALTVSYSAWDQDDEDETLTTTFQWYVDDVLLEGETGESLAAGLAKKGQTVKVLTTVSDGITSTSEFTSTAPFANAKPVVVMLNEISLIQENRTVTLDASASYDPDGDELSFAWEEVYEGQYPVVISDSTASVVQVTLPKYGSYGIKLTVTDTTAATEDYAYTIDTVYITVMAPDLLNEAQIVKSHEYPNWWYLGDIATGDINDDGLEDIAVVSQGIGSSNAISLVNQVSSGVFEPTATTFDPDVDLLGYTVGNAVAMLDVNQDGLLDVLFTSEPLSTSPAQIFVFYQMSDGGVYSHNADPDNDAPPSSFDAQVAAKFFRTGDFTGDGLDDLVAVGEDDSIVVYPQLSAGGLGAAINVVVPTGRIGPSGFTDLEVGDLNGDGLMDLVVGSPVIAFIQGSNGLEHVWHYNHYPVLYDGSTSVIEEETGGIGIGDIDGDGTDDIVVSYESQLGVFRSVGGLIHFDSPTFLDHGGIARAVDVADIDGDGLEDIVVNHVGNIGIYLQTEENDFSNVERLQFGQGWSNGSHSMALTDLNTDGKADVITLDIDNGIRVSIAK